MLILIILFLKYYINQKRWDTIEMETFTNDFEIHRNGHRLRCSTTFKRDFARFFGGCRLGWYTIKLDKQEKYKIKYNEKIKYNKKNKID